MEELTSIHDIVFGIIKKTPKHRESPEEFLSLTELAKEATANIAARKRRKDSHED
jgi:hypothetical protein